MAYQPPVRADFAFPSEFYLPKSSFTFYPEPGVIFLPPPSVVSQYQSQWSQGRGCEINKESLFLNASRQYSEHKVNYQDATASSALFQLNWGRLAYKEVTVSSSFKPAQPKDNKKADQWVQLTAMDSHRQSLWDQSVQNQDQQKNHHWQIPPRKDKQQTESFYRVDEFTEKTEDEYQGYQPAASILLDFYFSHRRYSPLSTPAVYFRFSVRPEKQAIRPKDARLNQRFDSHQAQDQPVKIPWGFGQKITDEHITSEYGGETEPQPDKPEPQQPDIRETYLLMNTISVVTLPDRIPLEMRELDISLDIDSFAWSLRGEIWGASSLAQVEPDSNGMKQIEVNINGWQWLFMIERYDTDRAFNRERYTIHGTSRTSLLAAPYAPLRSKSSTTSINVKQAATEELTNTGFTLNWLTTGSYTTPDWIIPGNTFSYQNQTAMQVIARIATTAGAVIIPDKNTDTLTIQPRYPASPWNWPETIMDKIVPASMVISLSASWQPEAEYNAVYVSGIYEGVSVNVKCQGTAADNPAPDIFEDWLTETQVNTERGRNELSKGGNQSITTIELPLTDTETAPGLIEPGKLVEVQDITGNWQALCLSTQVRAKMAKVTQTIELVRYFP
ncbi:hypothetical protein [Endozoicomonas sp. Mp262]|uniref:hypothetical protein n=1 Tax=Endozoicomonas sp. Mp262 TaxID=2919499 RepID=UPI0021D85AC2